MTQYLFVDGGEIVYPLTIRKVRELYPNVSFSAIPPDSVLAEFDIYPVAEVQAPPPSDPITVNVVEGSPQLVGNSWVQTWQEVPASPLEITQRTALAKYVLEQAELKNMALVQQFIAMSPVQVATYVANNGGSLADLRDKVVRPIAQMLLLLARKEFGNGA